MEAGIIKKSFLIGIILLFSVVNFSFTPPKSLVFGLFSSAGNPKEAALGKKLVDQLTKETGFEIELFISDSYEEMIGALQGGRVNFALVNASSYVIAAEKAEIEPALISIREGNKYYSGQIITHRHNKIYQLAGLNGKRIGVGNKLSASSYIYPMELLNDNKVEVAEQVFYETAAEIVEAVYLRKVDAGATYHSESTMGQINDARMLLKEKYPDIIRAVNIIALTETIPNDPLVFTSSVNKEDKETVVNAFKSIMATYEGKKVLEKLYGISGFEDTSPKDFKDLRKVLSKNGLI